MLCSPSMFLVAVPGCPDVWKFVSTCPTCAQSKTSHKPPSVLLRPLPVPRHARSHISLDFVTSLPSSDGNATVLTVVDRFSKTSHFIPLSKLPTAKETAELFLQHVFRLHNLPCNIVADRDPQFMVRFWAEFCRLLGITVSLSSSFPLSPMANLSALN